MITQTAEIAVKSMIYIALRGGEDPLAPKRIAEAMRCSPSYLAKILGLLAKAGLLLPRRGPHGGVVLARDPARVSLLEIVRAAQGVEIGSYCQAIGDALGPVCGFHHAMLDVHLSTERALARWSLADLSARPGPTGRLKGNAECRMHFLEARPAPAPSAREARRPRRKRPRAA